MDIEKEIDKIIEPVFVRISEVGLKHKNIDVATIATNLEQSLHALKDAVQSLLKLYEGEVVAECEVTGFIIEDNELFLHTTNGDLKVDSNKALKFDGQDIDIIIRHKGGK